MKAFHITFVELVKKKRKKAALLTFMFRLVGGQPVVIWHRHSWSKEVESMFCFDLGLVFGHMLTTP